MSIIEIVKAAVGNSLRSKLRTTLTVVAIFIGAFTLTITSAIGTGVSSYIDNQIGAFGAADVLSITKAQEDAAPAQEGPAPYDPDKGAVGGGMLGDSAFGTGILSEDDLEVIAGVDGILDVSPAHHVSPRYIEYGNNGKFELDVNHDAASVHPDLAAGAQLENDGAKRQILIVTSYVDSLGFASEADAVGKTITIGVADFAGEIHEVEATVAGVQNETILASGAALNSALVNEIVDQQDIGKPAFSEEGTFTVTAHFDANSSEQEIEALKADLLEQGYAASTVADKIGVLQSVVSGIVGVLNAFAVIALIAAGFGIINTLLMSVQERTREIGLMKAMGMGGGRIYALFSLEAIFIGFLGSVIGAVVAVGVGLVANGVLANTFLSELDGLQVLRFELLPMATIILVVMFIAFLAGTLPARRAARQNPIEALRYE